VWTRSVDGFHPLSRPRTKRKGTNWINGLAKASNFSVELRPYRYPSSTPKFDAWQVQGSRRDHHDTGRGLPPYELRRRGNANDDRPDDAWYTSTRWRQHRRRPQLVAHPLCEWCKRKGRIVEAQIAHHVVPHHGDPELFWHGDLISLCKHCHDGEAQQIERKG
jgi:5-methylcytosine-specific restriction enzyme A